MLHIITLLFCTSFPLFSMEPLQIEPTNSSSEIYFFTQQIDHNISQEYYLPADIKHKLLTVHIALTDDERNSSHRYNELIDAADYMNLNKDNKRYIQRLFSTTETPMTIHDINNNKRLILGVFPDAQVDYQNMLALPLKVRNKIANKYSPMIFVKAAEKDLSLLEAQDEEELELGLIIFVEAAIGIVLDNYIKIHPMFTWLIPSIILSGITKFIYDKCRPLTSDHAFKFYHYNGYTLLPLLPENEK